MHRLFLRAHSSSDIEFTMVWKKRHNKQSSGSIEPLPGNSQQSSTSKMKPPRKGSLRTTSTTNNGFSSDMSSPSSSESSGRSSSPSETEKCCDQSSTHHSQQSGGSVNSLSSHIESLASCDGNNHKKMSQAIQSVSSTTLSSSKMKRVQFSVVEIRDYERQIGDNPSCSDGCPISIGWTHLDSRVLQVNHFEKSRPYRKPQLELVLTREEREALLEEWGVRANEIVAGTRALVKAKNQRRQTIQNLSKAPMEESIETATRKLKEMLSLKKSTRTQLKQLQRQAEIVASLSRTFQEESNQPQQPEEPSIPYPEIVDASRHSSLSINLSPDGTSESADVSELPPSASALEEDTMDAISCISGFTLGNSTTASAREIEQFLEALEVELFGDQELPSMLGKTLEVDVQIPDEEKIYHDPSLNCGTQETASIVSDLLLDESVVHGRRPMQPQIQDQPQATSQEGYNVPYIPVTSLYDVHNRNGYGGYLGHGGHRGDHHDIRLYDTRRVGATLVSPEISELGPLFGAPQIRQRHAERIPYSTVNSTTSWSSVSSASTCDGPEVSHVPLSSYLSPNHWMEGTPSRRDVRDRSNPWEAVVISEEADDNILDGLFFEHQTEQYNLSARMGIPFE